MAQDRASGWMPARSGRRGPRFSASRSGSAAAEAWAGQAPATSTNSARGPADWGAMRKIVTLGLLVMSCGADGSDSASGTLGVERSLPSACSAKYSCEISGDTFETPLHEYGPYFSATLQEEDGVCVFEGKIEIQPGGQAFVPGEWPRKGEWSGSAEAFVLCVNGACATCERVGESAPSPGGRCTGSADSCSGRGAGSCSTQKPVHRLRQGLRGLRLDELLRGAGRVRVEMS